MSEQEIIQRQQEFVKWLKSKGLYNEFDSAVIMSRMQQIWEACQEPIKTFTLFWLTGKTELVKGKNITRAMNNAGYGSGSTLALDFWSEGDKRREYKWNKNNRSWDQVIFKEV